MLLASAEPQWTVCVWLNSCQKSLFNWEKSLVLFVVLLLMGKCRPVLIKLQPLQHLHQSLYQQLLFTSLRSLFCFIPWSLAQSPLKTKLVGSLMLRLTENAYCGNFSRWMCKISDSKSQPWFVSLPGRPLKTLCLCWTISWLLLK